MTKDRTPNTPSTTQAVVNVVKHQGRLYEARLNDCGKANCQKCGGDGRRHPSHGPYWYLCVPTGNKWRRIYLGKDLDTKRYIAPNGTVDWTQIRFKRSHGGQAEGGLTTDVPGQLDLVTFPPPDAPPPQAYIYPTPNDGPRAISVVKCYKDDRFGTCFLDSQDRLVHVNSPHLPAQPTAPLAQADLDKFALSRYLANATPDDPPPPTTAAARIAALEDQPTTP